MKRHNTPVDRSNREDSTFEQTSIERNVDPVTTNPYETPPPDKSIQADVSGKVIGPAVGLIAVGLLGVLPALYGIFVGIMITSGAQSEEFQQQFDKQLEQFQDGPEPPISPMQAMQIGGVFWLVMGIIWLIAALVIATAGIQMMRLRSWWLATTGMILAILPCSSGCCFIGIPIGIWGLIVLMDADVKSAFR